MKLQDLTSVRATGARGCRVHRVCVRVIAAALGWLGWSKDNSHRRQPRLGAVLAIAGAVVIVGAAAKRLR
jgi:hypothetical protein